jgi:hypothetical protein
MFGLVVTSVSLRLVIVRRLRSKHPEIWERNPLSSLVGSWGAVLINKIYWSSGLLDTQDAELHRLVRAARLADVVFYLAFGVAFVVFFFGVLGGR